MYSQARLCTKGIHGQVLIDILHWYPLSAFDQYPIDTSIDTWSTLNEHLVQQSVKSQPSFAAMLPSVDGYLVSLLMNECPSSVNWESTKYQLNCQSTVDRDIDQVSTDGWLMVQIDTQPRKPQRNMIQV